MIGIIPGNTKTYEVNGSFNDDNLVEGKLYYDPTDERLYYYSSSETRSNPENGYFPIWNGKSKFVSKFSNQKYLSDIVKLDIDNMCDSIDSDTADTVRYNHRRSDYQELLKPEIYNEDNFFTQIIKGVICKLDMTMIDLYDGGVPKLTEEQIESMYSSLSKITLMRMDKWLIWMNSILHKSFSFAVYDKSKLIVSYRYPENKFSVDDPRCDEIIKSNDDFLKKLIKITMIVMDVNKNQLRSDTTDEYTINNLMTSLNGDKPLSAQLFSRFMDMAHYQYVIAVYNDDGSVLFEFKDI